MGKTITIRFRNNKCWDRVYMRLSKYGDGEETIVEMTDRNADSEGASVFQSSVDLTRYDRVIFSDSRVQTTAVPLTMASSGFYLHQRADHEREVAGVCPCVQSDTGTLDTVSMDYPDGYKKKLYIWLPAGYDPADMDQRYPVLYMCDGQSLFGQADTLSGYDWKCDESILSLMQNGGKGVIIVGIAAGDTAILRNHELTPNLGSVVSIEGEDMSSYHNGGGGDFSDFVVNEIIPYVESRYHTSGVRGIAGSSSGGIEAFYIGMEHPDKFRCIGALSPAFILYDKAVWDSYLSQKDFAGNMPRIYFFCGNSRYDRLEQALYPNSVAMEGWLREHGYPEDRMTTVTDPEAAHSEAYWALYFPEMLCMGLEL